MILGRDVLAAVVACLVLSSCGISTTPGNAERALQRSSEASDPDSPAPEFDDGAEGTPGAWGRLTDPDTGATFVFPEAVMPGDAETVTGVDGAPFAQWYYFFESQGLATQVDLISPFEGGGMRLSADAVIRTVVRTIRSEGGTDVEVSWGRTRRNGAIRESTAEIRWREDGDLVFTSVGVFATRGMAVIVRAGVRAGDHVRRDRRRGKWAYDLMAAGIEVPVKPPNRSPTTSA